MQKQKKDWSQGTLHSEGKGTSKSSPSCPCMQLHSSFQCPTGGCHRSYLIGLANMYVAMLWLVENQKKPLGLANKAMLACYGTWSKINRSTFLEEEASVDFAPSHSAVFAWAKPPKNAYSVKAKALHSFKKQIKPCWSPPPYLLT